MLEKSIEKKTMQNTVKIFYSWQSDLSEKTNKLAIREILKKAKLKIESKATENLNIYIDEATNEEIGSPNIPQTIINKITTTDIFVADISIVNNENTGRKMPNPNVMYELGFAVAKLGWKRIILLFNKGLGHVNELPFDIDRHRVFQYALSVGDDTEKRKSIIGSQGNELYSHIDMILREAPEKECIKYHQSLEDIKRERDVENIKRFLSSIQLEIIDEFLAQIPKVIIDDIFYFHSRLEEIAKSSTFHMYNQDLYGLFVNFYNALDESLSHYEFYDHDIKVTRHIWLNAGDVPLDVGKKKIWDSIEDNKNIMRHSLYEILRILRSDYIFEIDVDLISKKNFQDLNRFKNQE